MLLKEFNHWSHNTQTCWAEQISRGNSMFDTEVLLKLSQWSKEMAEAKQGERNDGDEGKEGAELTLIYNTE